MKNGLLETEPFVGDEDLFNFYRLDHIGNYLSNYSDSYSNSTAYLDYSVCSDYDIDLMIMLQQGQSASAHSTVMIDNKKIIVLGGLREFGSFIHEFGHAFADLGDEYTNSLLYSDFINRPNLDTLGCPKWCSGNVNYDASINGFNCMDVLGEYYSCYEESGNARFCDDLQKERYNTPEDPRRLNGLWVCNIGVGCQEETGCYPNARSMYMFKSSENSYMNQSQTADNYNLISREAIQELLDDLREGKDVYYSSFNSIRQ